MSKNHFRPGKKYEFKKVLKHSCYRSCKREHLSECFVYIPKNDGVYCIFCSLFLTADKKRSLSSFVNNGYSEWHNDKEKRSRHLGNSYHQQTVLKAYGIIEKFENSTDTVKTIMDENVKQRYQVYLKVSETLARVVHLLGKQGPALRGRRKSSDASHNQSNFLVLVDEIALYYPLLKIIWRIHYHFVDFTRFLGWKCSHVAFKGVCVFKCIYWYCCFIFTFPDFLCLVDLICFTDILHFFWVLWHYFLFCCSFTFEMESSLTIFTLHPCLNIFITLHAIFTFNFPLFFLNIIILLILTFFRYFSVESFLLFFIFSVMYVIFSSFSNFLVWFSTSFCFGSVSVSGICIGCDCSVC